MVPLHLLLHPPTLPFSPLHPPLLLHLFPLFLLPLLLFASPQAQTVSSANGTSLSPSSFLSGAAGQDPLAQLNAAFRLPPEQQKQLLAAAQSLQAQQLKTLPANTASIVLQSGGTVALPAVSSSGVPAITPAKR